MLAQPLAGAVGYTRTVSSELKTVADNAGSSFESAPTTGGIVWQSIREHGSNVRMQNEIPGGLHLSFGVADIRTHSPVFGGFETRQPVIAAFTAPDGGTLFETEVKAGMARSFGIHISDLDAAESDPCISAIIRSVRGRPMAVIGGEAARRVAKLQVAIDPWFQGDARELVFQARAMELVAVVAEALKDPDRLSLRSIDLVRAHAVREQIEQDLGQVFRLDTLAKEQAIDTRVMTAAFKRSFGESIGVYITRRRMEEALSLLADGASVKTVAIMLGYTPNAFSTAFRRHYGYPPSRVQG